MARRMKSPRKEREKLRHRQEILSVALRLFADKGFYHVSMHEIAVELKERSHQMKKK